MYSNVVMSKRGPGEGVTPGVRNPQARIHAIVTAAAEVIMWHGPRALTHRTVASRAGVSVGSTTRYFETLEDLRVAALEQLSEELEQELAEIDEVLQGTDADFDAAIALFHDYLNDPAQLRATVTLLHAATIDEDLKRLALKWSEGLERVLSAHVKPHVAHTIAAYLDGVAIHTLIRGYSPPIGELQEMMYRILGRET